MQLVQEQDEHSPEQQLQEQGDILIVVVMEVNKNDTIKLSCWICIISDRVSCEDSRVEGEVRPTLYFPAHQLSTIVSKLRSQVRHPFPFPTSASYQSFKNKIQTPSYLVVESKWTSSASPFHLPPPTSVHFTHTRSASTDWAVLNSFTNGANHSSAVWPNHQNRIGG